MSTSTAETSAAEQAIALKAQGNKFFSTNAFQKALEFYTKSLEAQETAVVACNRALTYLKLELPGAAVTDADLALKLDPNYVKAYYRRASANVFLGKFKEAQKDLKILQDLVPDDENVNVKYDLCDREIKRIRFEKAIQCADSIPVSQTIKLGNIASNYVGPSISDDTVTEEFVMAMQDHLRLENKIDRRDVVWMLLELLKYFKTQPNFVTITVPHGETITVCGDTHGQFYDTLNIFKMNGNPSLTSRYLFNGDFVDRGSFSVENVLTLFAYKLLYPDHFFLSRGNHEGFAMNHFYGFEGEVKAKYSNEVFTLFLEVFNTLPVGHVINGEVFVVHGGLYSRDDVTLADLQKPDRFREIPDSGLICESLWSDPQPMAGRTPSKRGVNCPSFGPDVTRTFLENNNLKLVVRSHEVKDTGYEVAHDGKCITVFSAPNYCDQMGNKGAFVQFTAGDMKPKFTTFEAVPHPAKRAMQFASMLSAA